MIQTQGFLYSVVVVFAVGCIYSAQGTLQVCRKTRDYQTKNGTLGGEVTFDFCVTSRTRPHDEAFFKSVGFCKEDTLCKGKYQWSFIRLGNYNAYRVKIRLLSVQTSDFEGDSALFSDANNDEHTVKLRFKVTRLVNPSSETTSAKSQAPDPTPTTAAREKPTSSTPLTKTTTTAPATRSEGLVASTEEVTETLDNVASKSQFTSAPTSVTTKEIASNAASTASTSSPSSIETRQTSPTTISTTDTSLTLTTTSSSSSSSTTTSTSTSTPKISASAKITTSTPTPQPSTIAVTTSPPPTTTTTASEADTARVISKPEEESNASANGSSGCPSSWQPLTHNTSCYLLVQTAASFYSAHRRCLELNAHLLNPADDVWGENFTRPAGVLGLPSQPLLWIARDENMQNETQCEAFDAVSGRVELLACDADLSYVCVMNRTSYAKPSIGSMTVVVYTAEARSATNVSHTVYRRYHLDPATSSPQTVMLDSNGSLISVSCHARGWPEPEVTLFSTLIGGEGSDVTHSTGSSLQYEYRRPASVVGALGTVSCLASNVYGDEVATQGVKIAAAYKADILSFKSNLRQLHKGDTLTLRCKAVGFPAPRMRIIDERSGKPVVGAAQTKAKTVEYSVRDVTCGAGGWFRCEVEDAVSGEITVRETHAEVIPCPPTCPRDVQLIHHSKDNKIELSWKPGFNGGEEQSFIVFYKANNTKWRRFDFVLHADAASFWRNVLEFSPGTNYSFRIVPYNRFVVGKPDASACRQTVNYSTWRLQPTLESQGSPEMPFSLHSGHLDSADVIIVTASVVALGCILVIIFHTKIAKVYRKTKNRHLSTALEKLVHFSFFDTETNAETPDPNSSTSSSQSSVFESNT